MNATEFLNNFGHLADAPDGISKLRQTILQLAVQGKLVEQDPNDEPADELLAKISECRLNLMKEKKLKKEKVLAKIDRKNLSVQLPVNWTSVHIGDVTQIRTGYAFKSADYSESGVFVLRVTNIQPNGQIVPSNAKFLPEKKITGRIQNYLLEENDILVVMVGGSLGKIGVVTKDLLPALLNQNMWRVNAIGGLIEHGFLKLILSHINQFQLKITASTHGHLSMSQYREQIVLLPPLAEQKRIVAKVDELMALCDDLEAKQQERRAVHVRVNTAALDSLSTAGTDTDFDDAWSRVRSNFDLLYSVPENVNALRQAILQLAVQGKLVEQDTNDEPASKLFSLIKKQNKSSKEKPVRSSYDENKIIPTGWISTTLGQCIQLIGGTHLKPDKYNTDGNGHPYLTGPADFGDQYPLARKWTLENNALANYGDLLITVKGSGIGKTNIVNTETAFISRQLMAIRPILIETNYVHHFLKSCYRLLQSHGVGIAIPGISRRDICDLFFLLPPLAEQKRIVTKVDELMALCDDLEAKLTQQQGDADQLTEAMVAAVLDNAAA